MSQRNDTAIWSGLFRISAESGQTLQAQIRQAIVAAILDRLNQQGTVVVLGAQESIEQANAEREGFLQVKKVL